MTSLKLLLLNSFGYLKFFCFKIYCSLLIVADKDSSIWERITSFFQSLLLFAPVAFVASTLNAWYMSNQKFTIFLVILIIANMILGGIMHFMKGSFKWKILLKKSIEMIVVVGLAYMVFEMVISSGGDNIVTQGFRAILQMSSLLYPGSKILKHVFVLSKGEHPPKHLMQRIYNFKENGDLAQFLAPKAAEE